MQAPEKPVPIRFNGSNRSDFLVSQGHEARKRHQFGFFFFVKKI